MATRTWSGTAGDGNWDTVSNWGGTKPVTGDSVIISATATSGITTGLDRSADGAGAGLNIVSFTIQKGFLYDIGTNASPLRMTADRFVDLGNGAVYFASATGSAALNTDRVIIDKENIAAPVYLTGTGLSYTLLVEIVRGSNVYLEEGSGNSITSLWIAPRSDPFDVRVFGIGPDVSIANTYMSGGTFVVDGAVPGTIAFGNGVLDFRSSAITTLNQSGGMFLHNGEAANYQVVTYNAMNGFMRSSDTSGGKLIGTLNRAPQWQMDHNLDLTVNATNYIGG